MNLKVEEYFIILKKYIFNKILFRNIKYSRIFYFYFLFILIYFLKFLIIYLTFIIFYIINKKKIK
jgi:hypothetical protein